MKVLLLLVVMARVTGVSDKATLIVEKDAKQVEVKLAGVEVTDLLGARELLQWSVVDSWVMLEGTDAQAYVYRSPDAMFINRELVERGFARATLAGILRAPRVPVTYHGQMQIGPREPAKSGAPAPRSRTGSRTSRPQAKKR